MCICCANSAAGSLSTKINDLSSKFTACIRNYSPASDIAHMKRLFTSIIIILLLPVLWGCSHGPKQIVFPVAGRFQDDQQQKAEMIERMRSDFPELQPHELEAIDSIPRTFFVTSAAHHRSYDDKSLPIGSGQSTIKLSDLAFLLIQLKIQPTDRILEVGTGTGYLAAVLSRLAGEVYSVEIIEYLYEIAVSRLELMNIGNVHLKCNDGLNGWAKNAPYDVIIVSAAVRDIPQALLNQLKSEARLAAPIIDESGKTVWYVYHWHDEELESIAKHPSKVQAAILPSELESEESAN